MLFSEENDTDCHQVQLPAQSRTSLDAKLDAKETLAEEKKKTNEKLMKGGGESTE